MKKFFSAILLIAAMAFSVSTFVSCNDLVEEVEDVTAQAGANAEAIKALQAQLESGLASANAAVEAAKTAAEKAVAEAKKAAIEEALAQAKELDAENTEAIEAVKALVNAINGDIDSLEAADAALKTQIDALEKYLEFDGEKSAVVEELLKKLEALQAKVEDASVLDDIKKEFEAMKKELQDKIDGLDILGDVEALIKLIQSVTYVPEKQEITNIGIVRLTGWANNMYDVKGDDNIKYVLATYEVYPKDAVKTIENENLKFATVETKVAPASYFNAEIIQKDVTTGRMLVLGVIKNDEDNRAVFKNLNKQSLALVVSDKDFEYGKPGNSVSSEYVKVETANEVFEITDHIGWVNEDKTFGSYERVVKVPFDKSEESERELFNVSTDDLVVNFNGTYLTQKQVKDIFGIEIVVKYDSKPVETDFTGKSFKYEQIGTAPNKKDNDSSIVAENTDEYFKATAKMQKPKNTKPEGEDDEFDWVDAIGDQLVVTIPEFTVNGAEVDLTATSTYVITHTGGAIIITAPEKIDWNYKYAPEWKEIYELGSTSMTGNSFLATMDELPVTLPTGVDLTSVKATDGKDGADVTPAGYIQMVGQAKYSDGEDAPYTANIWVRAMGKSIVRIAGSTPGTPTGTTGLKFADEDLYWDFKGTAYDGAGKAYEVTFDEPVVTKAVPQYKGAVIEKTVNVDGYLNLDMKSNKETDIIGSMVGAMKIFNTDTDNLKNELYDEFKKPDAVEIETVSLTGIRGDKTKTEIAGLNAGKLGFALAYQQKNATATPAVDFKELSTLTMKKEVYGGNAFNKLKHGDVLTWRFNATVFGVTYPFEYTINVVAPSIGTLLVYDGVNTTNGVVDLKTYGGDASSGYKIPAINLKNYYRQTEQLTNLLKGIVDANGDGVYDPATETVTGLASEFIVDYKVVTNYVTNPVQLLGKDAIGYVANAPVQYAPVATAVDGDVIFDYSDKSGEKIFNTKKFEFQVVVRTVGDVKWNSSLNSGAGDWEPAVVASKNFEFTVPQLVDIKAGEFYPSVEADKDVKIETSIKVIVTDTDKAGNGNQWDILTNVSKALQIKTLFDGTNSPLAANYISKVEMVEKYAVDQDGEYWFTNDKKDEVNLANTSGEVSAATGGKFYKVDDDTPAGVTTYKLWKEPVFYNNASTPAIFDPMDRTAAWDFSSLFTSVNVALVQFDHVKTPITGLSSDEVLIADGSADYVNPNQSKYTSTTNSYKSYAYNGPTRTADFDGTDWLVTYDIATGNIMLNPKRLVAGVDMTDIEVVVPVTVHARYQGETTVYVKVIFTDDAKKADGTPKTFYDNVSK